MQCGNKEEYEKFLFLCHETFNTRIDRSVLLMRIFRATFHLDLPFVRYTIRSGEYHGGSYCVILLAAYYAVFLKKNVLVMTANTESALKTKNCIERVISTLLLRPGKFYYNAWPFYTFEIFHPDSNFELRTRISILCMYNRDSFNQSYDMLLIDSYHVLLIDDYHLVSSPGRWSSFTACPTNLIRYFVERQRSVITFSIRNTTPECLYGKYCHNTKCVSISTFEVDGAEDTLIEKGFGDMSIK